MTVGTWRAISAASCSGPGRQRVVGAGDGLAGAARGGDQRRGRTGSARCARAAPTRRVHFSASAASSASARDSASIAASTSGVEVALVEQQRRLAGDRRDDARLGVGRARGGDAAVADRGVAHREREARRGEERVAPVRHRRRAGVRGLAAEDHAVALDADRAEHGADRQPEALEHRPLLDVQLEVGAHVAQAPLGTPTRGRARRRARRRRPRGASRSRRAGRAPRRGRACRTRRRSRTGCGRSARPPRRPSRRASRCTAACPASAIERSVSSAPITPSAPSSQPPFGTESMCEPITTVSGRSPARRAQRLPASSTSTSTGSSASASRSRPRAFSHSSVQHSRRAPPGPPVSSASARRSAIARSG